MVHAVPQVGVHSRDGRWHAEQRTEGPVRVYLLPLKLAAAPTCSTGSAAKPLYEYIQFYGPTHHGTIAPQAPPFFWGEEMTKSTS